MKHRYRFIGVTPYFGFDAQSEFVDPSGFAGPLVKTRSLLEAGGASAPTRDGGHFLVIPFVKFGGLKFLEAALIKDVLAFLRWAENPRDRVAGFRAIQLLPGVGPATAAQVLDRLADHSDPVRGLSEFTPPAAAVEHWSSFIEAVRLAGGKSAEWPAELDLIRTIQLRQPVRGTIYRPDLWKVY